MRPCFWSHGNRKQPSILNAEDANFTRAQVGSLLLGISWPGDCARAGTLASRYVPLLCTRDAARVTRSCPETQNLLGVNFLYMFHQVIGSFGASQLY